MNRIIAICLLKNEDLYLPRVLTNIRDFADEILIADHASTDRTGDIAQKWAAQHAHISYRRIRHPGESHEWIRGYVNQPVWAFGVDGDEIYDPEGLKRLRTDLQSGTYDQYRQLYGHAFHCDALSEETGLVQGYTTPPCRTITKLYNFNAYQDWAGPCPERFHGGTVMLNQGWTKEDNGWLYKAMPWEECPFRCLHTVFLPRSSQDPENHVPRKNISEQNQMTRVRRLISSLKQRKGTPEASAYKQEKYRRGERLTLDASAFFKETPEP